MRCLLLLFVIHSSVFAATPLAVKVVERVEQDPTLFTQGLEIYQGRFFQSSGLYGKSYVLRFAQDGEDKPLRMDVPPNACAEGLTALNRRLYLLSWQSQMAWRFDPNTLQLEKTFHYSGEGWGLAHNNTQLILSDGSADLKFIDPQDFSLVNTIRVQQGGVPVNQLNELEYVDDVIWANQWKSNTLFGIDPNTGTVLYTADISFLQQEAAVSDIDSVANGIAYDEKKQASWITGKYWQYRYLVKFAGL